MLQFGARAPMTFGKFLEACDDLVSEDELDILRKVKTEPTFFFETIPVFDKWRAFETGLRNALVKIRAARKHVDPAKHLRPDGYEEPALMTLAMNAHKNPSILESEKMLDRARWRALDEFEAGHYFDIDFLVVYALKLLILEKWERTRTSNASNLLEETVPQKEGQTPFLNDFNKRV